jgi:hypothetical protein
VLVKTSSKLLLKYVSQEFAVSHELLSMEAEESALLKAATKRRVCENTAEWEDLEHASAMCRVGRTVKAL